MEESDFWPRLEYRVCRELAGMLDRRASSFWCDGFIPNQYLLAEKVPKILGRVWICTGQDQFEWQFVLYLPGPIGKREDIDWASLVPPDDMTKWLSFDERGKIIEMEPSVAVPDREQPPSIAKARQLPEGARIVAVIVDSQKCLDHEMCMHLCPQVFEYRDSSARVKSDAADYYESHRTQILAAEDACPTEAIHVQIGGTKPAPAADRGSG